MAHRQSVRPSYSWPLKPFERQHPIRGYLNDPRNGGGHGESFHFGIDIAAPDGSPVYAVEAGEVFVTAGHNAVAVRGATRIFGYWHVVPAVRDRQRVELHQLVGYVARGAHHVHFTEKGRRSGLNLNPLRPGGIGPYVDRTPPTVTRIAFMRNRREISPDRAAGRVDIVIQAFDTTPLRVQPMAWADLPVTPARIRWGIVSGSRRIVPMRTAVDFRHAMLSARLYRRVYAPGTRQNWPRRRGVYRFYAARRFDLARLPDAPCLLRIEAEDTRGNLALAELQIGTALPRS